MKHFLIPFLLMQCLISNAQVLVPQSSPAATVSTIVGLTEVKVDYFRPKTKGRKIFGPTSEYVVQYGELWRTAANGGSKISFNEDVKFGGKDVPKGSYLLLTIPNEKEWTIILYKDIQMGGDLENYDQAKDLVRVTAKPAKLAERVEAFTFEIADLSENCKTANLQLMWENTSVKIPMVVDFDARVLRSIDANTKIIPNNLVVSAVYYLENGKDLNQALNWINTALESDPSAFWMLYQKARIQKGLNDKKGAIATAKASLAEAIKANREDFQRMNEELIKSLN